MKRLSSVISLAWHRIPQHWRVRVIAWLLTAGLSRLMILVFGVDWFLAFLILVSGAGFVLKKYGIRHAQCLETLLGNVWGYFRGVIVVALLMSMWPAFKSIFSGDIAYGLIQVLIIALIIVLVFERFRMLPRSWSTLARGQYSYNQTKKMIHRNNYRRRRR